MEIKLNEVLQDTETLYPGLRETACLVLAAAATNCLDRQHPLAVILIGGPSSGKTSLLMPLTKGKKESTLAGMVVRVDDFSPKSFVSHVGGKKEEDLRKSDLLPKIRDRVVICKEMAPLFSGHEDDLKKTFAVLASVLDGEGYISSSGMHGMRGYDEPTCFTLIGAVTPEVLSAKVHSAMSAVGPRFCFWAMPRREVSPLNYRGPSVDRRPLEQALQQALSCFMDRLFERHPARSVHRSEFSFDEAIVSKLSAIAALMARARSKITVERDQSEIVEVSHSLESPDRSFRYLEQLVMGAAIIDGRRHFLDVDTGLALKMAISSAPSIRRKMLEMFFAQDTPRTVHDVVTKLGVSDDTARKHLGNLVFLEILREVQFDGTKQWDLASPFKELVPLTTGIPLRPPSPPKNRDSDLFGLKT